MSYSPAVYAAARSFAASAPSQIGGFDAMASHRQNQLLMRMDQAIRAASIFLAKPSPPEPTVEQIIDDIVALPNEDSFPMAFSRSSAAHIAPSVLKIVNKYRPTTAKDTP